jgi:hypothetical protein
MHQTTIQYLQEILLQNQERTPIFLHREAVLLEAALEVVVVQAVAAEEAEEVNTNQFDLNYT